jgi:hypothetical protein
MEGKEPSLFFFSFSFQPVSVRDVNTYTFRAECHMYVVKKKKIFTENFPKRFFSPVFFFLYSLFFIGSFGDISKR